MTLRCPVSLAVPRYQLLVAAIEADFLSSPLNGRIAAVGVEEQRLRQPDPLQYSGSPLVRERNT